MKHLIFGILFSCAAALTAATPAAQYDFDDSTGLPDTALKGKGKVEYVDGVKGKAIKMSDNTLTIPCPEGMTAEEGTIAMWIKPVNWDSSREEFVFFLFNQNQEKDGRMILYKYRNPNGLGLTFWYGNPDDAKKKAVSAWPKADYQQGEWIFYAVTWSKKSGLTGLFFNGKRYTGSRCAADIFYQKFGDFILNAPPFRPANREMETAYDLIRFYPEALSSGEIEKLYTEDVKSIQK